MEMKYIESALPPFSNLWLVIIVSQRHALDKHGSTNVN